LTPRTVLVAASGASGSVYTRRVLQILLSCVERVYFTYSRHAIEVMRHELGFDLSASGGDLTALLQYAPETDIDQGASRPEQRSHAGVSDYSGDLRVVAPDDLTAPFASGSGVCDVTIVAPCSMGMVSRIAHGASDDLISRAADVALKERRRLILCPRETPLNAIHLRNMLLVTEAGAIVAPAMPNFYTRPRTLDDLVDTVAWRLLALAGLDLPEHLRWGGEQPE